ncbi:hypothetical protein DFP72DRAFT_845784 [Ephemerocybe angulata]|uniref:Uncharacterized protein n=1 Tax=Ephemerocybe angulata TaxID=980116 RepID=A0A8H6M8Z0_9AGAR|nr:hypothetical protein DFP72DRAFT_845784 [Tulosesus angulatus]
MKGYESVVYGGIVLFLFLLPWGLDFWFRCHSPGYQKGKNDEKEFQQRELPNLGKAPLASPDTSKRVPVHQDTIDFSCREGSQEVIRALNGGKAGINCGQLFVSRPPPFARILTKFREHLDKISGSLKIERMVEISAFADVIVGYRYPGDWKLNRIRETLQSDFRKVTATDPRAMPSIPALQLSKFQRQKSAIFHPCRQDLRLLLHLAPNALFLPTCQGAQALAPTIRCSGGYARRMRAWVGWWRGSLSAMVPRGLQTSDDGNTVLKVKLVFPFYLPRLSMSATRCQVVSRLAILLLAMASRFQRRRLSPDHLPASDDTASRLRQRQYLLAATVSRSCKKAPKSAVARDTNPERPDLAVHALPGAGGGRSRGPRKTTKTDKRWLRAVGYLCPPSATAIGLPFSIATFYSRPHVKRKTMVLGKSFQ